MKKWNMYLITVFLFAFSAILFAQKIKVEDIRNNPYSFIGNKVTVEGLVTQFVHDVGTTDYYLLKDDFGAIIKINTAEGAPVTNKKYSVVGIVYVEQPNGRPFISEKSRAMLEVPTAITPPDQQSHKTPETNLVQPTNDNLIIYILSGAVVVLIALYFILKSRKSKSASSDSYAPPAFTPAQPTPLSGPTVKLDMSDLQQQSGDDFKTIKIAASSPKTLKFIPGRLTIVSGEDTGKSFKIVGYPTPDGNVVTIGREEVKGDRAYSHIQLLQKTISRKQAEFIQRDGRLLVKNLSDTNLTQLDGVELKVNEKAELKTGSVMRIGELEVKYEV